MLQKCHPHLLPAYEKHKEKCRKEAQKIKMENRAFTPHDRVAKRPKLIQTTMRQASSTVNSGTPVTQKEADKLIQDYIVNSLSPISHIEHCSFIALVRGLAPHVNLSSRWTLSRRIEEQQRSMLDELKQLISKHSFICITADAWTGFKNRRSFMGVTGHTINDDLSRRSFALACRLFSGTHSYDRIASLLSDILKQYGIPVDKVVCCVTDNGSNFVKAFKEFHVDVPNEGSESSDGEESEDSYDQQQVDLFNLIASQSQVENHADVSQEQDDDPIVLPPHQRCASHTLNLVGCNSPPQAAKQNAKYRSLMHSSNAKLSAIWNKVNSPKSNEIISSVLGCQLVTPVQTRWNSYYDARRSLLLHSSDKIDLLCTSLGVPNFKEAEFAFMNEEMQVLTPLAQGLDRLQGHSNPESYMAFLYPTLLQLRHNYAELANSQALKYCSPLATVISADINRRFEGYYSFAESTRPAALATITHPAFKLRWLSTDGVETMKNLFLNTLKISSTSEHRQNWSDSTNVNEALDSNTLDFFTFMQDGQCEPRRTLQSQAELEGLQYLEDTDKTLRSLQRYPRVSEMFKRYNVALPSSAAVERLFSVGGMISTAKRNRLRPSLFESLLLQRVNNMSLLHKS